MTPLLDSLLDLLDGWRTVFPQKRTFARAMRLALAQVLAPGCRTISRIIAACGLDQQDWSADYRVFSRSPWQQQRLFEVPVAAGLEYFAGRDYISVAGDFTHLAKTGKKITGVFWPNGAGRRPLRLIVLASTPYRNSPNGKTNYRQPAYLLTTDLKRSVEAIIQCYLDRWQIEVNHREEKSNFGVGDAQVRNPMSVPRQPAFVVAIYAMMLLAAQKAYGSRRVDAYVPLPKWRKGAKRPSCQDIVSELRREMESDPEKLRNFATRTGVMAAATFRAAA